MVQQITVTLGSEIG
jgi:hypothetical protein